MRALLALVLAHVLAALPLLAAPKKPRVKITTSMGAFVVELEPEVAPRTVENFLGYVRKGYFSGTIFHRAMPGYIAQGGGYLPSLEKKMPTDPSIPNEADLALAKGLRNRRGTVAMAWPVGNPFGAQAQFFVNLQDSPKLDFKAKTMTQHGYCPFGRVVQGLEVPARISRVKTTTRGTFKDVPVEHVFIEKAEVLP